MSQFPIETDRLRLRPHNPGDHDAMVDIFTHPEVLRFLALPVPPSPEDLWHRLLRYIGHWTALGFGMFAVEDKASGRVVGETGFADFRRALGPAFDGVPEAAWIFHPDVHGRGVAGEAVRAAHTWLDDGKRAGRTVCIIAPGNGPSLRMGGALGYKPFSTCTYKGKPFAMLERLGPGNAD